MKKRENLVGLEKMTEFMKVALASGYLMNDKPISLFIKAPYGSGKTTLTKQFKDNKNVRILTDVTAYGILHNYQNDLRAGNIRHFILPDLLNAMSRRNTTVETLLLFINASSEDGIFPCKTYNIEVNEYIPPFGWILCITNDGYNMKKDFIRSVGFENRFFVINHEYTQETVDKILKNIIEEDIFQIPEIKVDSFRKKKSIKGNKSIFEELKTYSLLLCKDKNNRSEILRIQRLLQTFLKASALLRKDDQVRKEDLEKLKELMELIKW